jgi:hypothetical protein
MATEFSIFQVKEETNTTLLPWVDEFKNAPLIFEERRPLIEFYDIRAALYKKNKGGDDYVEILPDDYHLLEKYIDLTQHEKQGCKFVCCII